MARTPNIEKYREIINLVELGYSARQIQRELGVSPNTISNAKRWYKNRNNAMNEIAIAAGVYDNDKDNDKDNNSIFDNNNNNDSYPVTSTLRTKEWDHGGEMPPIPAANNHSLNYEQILEKLSEYGKRSSNREYKMVAKALDGITGNDRFQARRIKDAIRMLIDMGIKFVERNK